MQECLQVMHAAGKAAGPALARLAGEQDACSHPAQALRQAIVVLGKHLPECPAARRLFLRLIVRYLPPLLCSPMCSGNQYLLRGLQP